MAAETELERRAAVGDAAAFTQLVRLHEAALRRFLSRLTRNQGADDLAQEVFLKAWRTGSSWRGEGRYRSWLMRIAWTSYLAARRGQERQAARDHRAWEHDCPAEPEPHAAIDLGRALAALDERERAAAQLCFGEGCSHGEAAEILGLPLGTLKSIVARARMKLAALLEAGND